MHIHVKKQRQRGNVWKFSAEARVGGQLKAEATYAAMILDS
jgi:3-hydroxyacyl-[acyl-carrier-protein] dehydratase